VIKQIVQKREKCITKEEQYPKFERIKQEKNRIKRAKNNDNIYRLSKERIMRRESRKTKDKWR